MKKICATPALILFSICSFISCHVQKLSGISGMIIYRANFYNPIQGKYINDQGSYPDRKIWYRDSVVIEEMTGLHIGFTPEDDKRWTIFMGYVYIDLRSRSFYEYDTFTDTATLVKKFTQPDSIQVYGGWNFYNHNINHVKNTEIVEALPDTAIDGINYKRAGIGSVSNDKNKKPVTTYIAYFNCNKKKLLFDLDKVLSPKINCPMVRWEVVPSTGRKPTVQVLIEYVADTLTPKQIKIFDAWGKYADEHPVLKSDTVTKTSFSK